MDDADADAGFDAFARCERRALVAFAWSLTGDGAAAEDLAQGVEVSSAGVPQDEVLRFVESLRPADQAETDELVSAYGIEHGTPIHPDAQPDDG